MSTETADDRYLPKRYSQNFSDTITVLVGSWQKQESFTIHKDLICANSKFFEAACSRRWAEGREKVVHLPEVKVGTFQAYVVWVYSGKVLVNTPTKDPTDKSGTEFVETVELYLLGDILDDLQLRNAAMRTLVNKNKDWMIHPSTRIMTVIWDSTRPGSLLRQMLVDKTIIRFGRDAIEQHSADYPKNFIRSVAIALMKRVPTESCDVFAAGLDRYLEPEVRGEPDKAK